MKGYTIYKKLKIEIEKAALGGDAHLCNELADNMKRRGYSVAWYHPWFGTTKREFKSC